MFQGHHAPYLTDFTAQHIFEVNARIIDTCGMSSDELCEAMFLLFSKSDLQLTPTKRMETDVFV